MAALSTAFSQTMALLADLNPGGETTTVVSRVFTPFLEAICPLGASPLIDCFEVCSVRIGHPAHAHGPVFL